jgi:secretion/DNA translocation related TadE-like protein
MMRRCVAPRRRDVRAAGERGSAVPFAVAALGVVLTTGVVLAVVGALLVDHRRAQAAADLAALAGASARQQGGDGCGAASRIAARNGAHLSACEVTGDDVTLTVVVEGPEILGSRPRLSAEARAGPG